MRWAAFVEASPEIAGLAEERFRDDELVLIGSLRKDGSPRVSPNEIDFAGGDLCFSMMWESMKARDLLRDPRCAVHSLPSGRLNPGGDIKLYGRAIDVRDPAMREVYREAIRARISWAPEEPNYHCFALDVRSAAYIVFGDDRRVLVWDQVRGVRRLPFPE